MTDRTLVVVGGGLAGAKAAEGAREHGFDGRVVIVGDEPGVPYERPPLSKAVLRGEAPAATTHVHDERYYADHEIDVLSERVAERLDLDAKQVHLRDGETLPFSALVLATGAAPRQLEVPGATLDGVHYLRTVADARDISDAIRSGGRVAVVGAGWIGSEVAASARQMGAEVVVVDHSSVPLQRVLGDEIGAVFGRLHSDHGVGLRLGHGVTALRGYGTVEEVVLDDGSVEAADVVVAGIGVNPRVKLGAAAGLKIDDGIVVDEHLQTAVAGVYAAGDVASAWHPRYRRHLRVEHWANALNQGLTAGANVAAGAETYERLPYFFSDQYDLGLEYVGHSQPGDTVVVRGNLAEHEFVAFWQRDGLVTAAMAVNVWGIVDDLRALITGGRPVDELYPPSWKSSAHV